MSKFSADFKQSGTNIFKECCDGVEKFHAHVASIHSSKLVDCPTENSFKGHDNPYNILGDFFKFIHAQYIAKYQELTSAFIESINSKNYLVAALCGRSIIEATATLRWYNQKILKEVEINGQLDSNSERFGDKEFIDAALNIINEHMKGSRFDWSKFFTSDKKTFVNELIEKAKSKEKQVEYPQSLPISRLLDSWSKDMPELHLFYDFYSDLVHPNLGSNLLLMGVSNNTTQIGETSNKSVGKKICSEAVIFLAPCLKEAAWQLARSVMLSSLGDSVINSEKNIH